MEYNCIVLLGPTASGKTKRAVALAEARGGEIISADSRQVYCGLDIGTGKDLECYTVPYHLIDIISLSQEYSVFSFLRDSYAAFESIRARGKLPIIAGGTGLYLSAFICGYTFGENAASDGNPRHRTHRGESEKLLRPDIRPEILGQRMSRILLRERIGKRLAERVKAGMVEETEALHKNGASWERLDRLGLEYRFCARFLQGLIPQKEVFYDTLFHRICQFAKRQETWFRGMEKQGLPIRWEGPPE